MQKYAPGRSVFCFRGIITAMRNNNYLTWTILAGASLLSAGLIVFCYYPFGLDMEASTGSYAINATRYSSALDGMPVSRKTETNPQVVAVMIDNHPDARPQFGLAAAKVVYEAPVEGGITRYMAIFDSRQSIAQVGPVRSARPYFLDWLEEYGRGVYMHSGGSPDALAQIPQRNIFDANEFYYGGYYWRSSDRQAPHNLYSKSDLWQSFVEKYATSTDAMPVGSGWKFSATAAQGGSPQQAVAIYYGGDYVVSWKYDAKTGNYVRYVNGVKYADAGGSEIRAKNVIVQYAAVSVIDEEGRRAVATTGGGDARVLQGGQMIRAVWTKTSVTDRTRFYPASTPGSEIGLLPGAVWIEVVPKETNVIITN